MYKEYRADPLPSRSLAGRFHGTTSSGRVTYLAASRETAWREVTSRWGGDPAAYWMVEVSVRLEKVADLTDPGLQARYGLGEHALTDANYQPCQRLAERLREEGYEGAWTFSRADRPRGRQLVVFLDRVRPSSGVHVETVKPMRDVLPRP